MPSWTKQLTQLLQDSMGWSAARINTATTTQVLTGPGILHSVVVNNKGATVASAARSQGTITGLTALSTCVAAGFDDGDSLTLASTGFDPVSIAFAASGGDIDTDTATLQDVIDEINTQAGATIATIATGKLTITCPDTSNDIDVGGTNTSGLADSTHDATLSRVRVFDGTDDTGVLLCVLDTENLFGSFEYDANVSDGIYVETDKTSGIDVTVLYRAL